MYTVTYRTMNKSDIEEAAGMVLAAYEEERQHLPFLPEKKVFRDDVLKLLARLSGRGISLVAECGGGIEGFIVGVEFDELWGSHRGFYCPLFGHGAKKENRSRIYQGLYTQLAGLQNFFRERYTRAPGGILMTWI